ncbi:glutamate 5-kinase [Acetobacteraceae bacterium B3987]|nr:glutamate 5-kinase [Acetobacteraceae bacterium B3987]
MGTMSSLPSLTGAKRLVIKIGSALMVDPQQATPRYEWLDSVAADIAFLRERGVQVCVVSSGAIALARYRLGLTGGTLRLAEKQAAASVGQVLLAQAWAEALERHGMTASQILLTAEDTEERQRYLNGRATLQTLLEMGCVPVINENDTIATAEIRFGDNDRLAARIAQMIGADQLVLLSDIDGLYDSDPRSNPEAAHLPVIDRLTPEIMAMGGNPPPGYSSGGMRTKLLAASMVTQSGCAMVIAQGAMNHPLSAVLEGGRCSWFLPATEALTARQQWIAGGLKPGVALVIDAGACEALKQGGSLLPAGLVRVEGQFSQGEPVPILDEDGTCLAYGLPAYDSDEMIRLIGCQSGEITRKLGREGPDSIVHRNDLAMMP